MVGRQSATTLTAFTPGNGVCYQEYESSVFRGQILGGVSRFQKSDVGSNSQQSDEKKGGWQESLEWLESENMLAAPLVACKPQRTAKENRRERVFYSSIDSYTSLRPAQGRPMREPTGLLP